jgi:hypothetical protein
MGVRAKFKTFIKGFKFRFFELPKRMDDIVKQFGTLSTSVHEHNTLVLDMVMRLTGYDSAFHSYHLEIEKEKKLRLEQGKRANEKVRNIASELNKFIDKIENIKIQYSALEIIVNKKNKKAAHLIERFEWSLNNFEKIEVITLKAKDHYDKYLLQLQRDISEFKETDQAVRRLAHLEERITLMELKYREYSHNDSGKITSRSITTY